MLIEDTQVSAWHGRGSGQLVLISAAGLLVVAAVAHIAATGLRQPPIAVSFGVLIAVGELARMNMPGNREVAPIATAGALGYTLLLAVGFGVTTDGTTTPLPTDHSGLQVIAVTASGIVLGALPHIVVGRPARLDAMCRRILAVSLIAFAYRPVAPVFADRDSWLLTFPIMVAFVALAVLVEALIAAMLRADQLSAAFGVALYDELRAATPLGAAVGASAILLAMAASVMGVVALLIFAAPLLVTQVAFRKYAGIRATYLQTIRALSRVTEVGGYVEPGHSRRVSRLSVAVGRELGMYEPELLELEYAALMHDIGQLSLRDPIPGGATILVSPDQAHQIAEHGAEVIRQTGVLGPVAKIVQHQCHPYRLNGEPTPAPLASRIIKVTNAFDDMVGSSADRDRRAAAIERMRLDSATEYDPTVVEAFARVVDRLTPAAF